MKPLFKTILCLGILFTAASPALGAGYALLVGIGDYPGVDADLQGPTNDVPALKMRLVRRFGLPEGHITTLMNQDAAKTRILSALDALYEKSAPGDSIFIYYSGHGTGYYDPNVFQQISLDTGGLVPYDANSKTSKEYLNTIIIAKRDLRPRFEKMDRNGRRLFVAFDACFSENSIRSAVQRYAVVRFYPPPPFRNQRGSNPLGLEELEDSETPGNPGEDARKIHPHPYKNLVYLAAAARDQTAVDVTSMDIRHGRYRTVDDRPHGAFTDALLRALDGGADTNDDQKLTPREIAHFVGTWAATSFDQLPQFLEKPHTPQFRYDKNNPPAADTPLFAKTLQSQEDNTGTPTPNDSLTIRLENPAGDLSRRVQSIPGIKTTTGEDFDLLVRKEGNLFCVYSTGGAPMWESGDANDLVDRLGRHRRVRDLVGLTYPEQPFNVFLEIIEKRGIHVEGQKIGFRIRTREKSHILLINIEVNGDINVNYPYFKRELNPVPENGIIPLPRISTIKGPDFGVEYMKVFAFAKNHPVLKTLRKKKFTPASPLFDALMDAVDTTGGNIAQSTVQINTCAKAEVIVPR